MYKRKLLPTYFNEYLEKLNSVFKCLILSIYLKYVTYEYYTYMYVYVYLGMHII